MIAKTGLANMKRLLLIFLRTALSSSSVVQGEEIHRIDRCIIHDDQPASAAFSDIAFRFANLQMCNRRSDMYCLPTCIETNKSQGCIAQCVASNLLTQILPTSSICLVAHHAKALKQKGSYATIGLTIPCIALRWHMSVLSLSIDPLILIPHQEVCLACNSTYAGNGIPFSFCQVGSEVLSKFGKYFRTHLTKAEWNTFRGQKEGCTCQNVLKQKRRTGMLLPGCLSGDESCRHRLAVTLSTRALLMACCWWNATTGLICVDYQLYKAFIARASESCTKPSWPLRQRASVADRA